ncbi:MAG: thioredoxin-dependent thiol peroxidase [Haloarculaceae archaeon]
MLDPGEEAPAFELTAHDGEPVSLADYEGQHVVLYFYPRADTPGCTTEACGFRDAWDEFADRDVAVLGVSNDPVENLQPFREKYDLPFTLLSDPDCGVAEAYESAGEVEVDGDVYDVAHRNTYVIGPDGHVEAVYEDVSPDGHATELLADLA